MTKYVLTYFDSRGRAEPIRLVFALAGVAYEDRGVKGEDWPKLKPDTPFGQLPFLTADGRVIPQTMAIVRYLAREHGLDGRDAGERLAVDVASETALDARVAFGQIRFSPQWQDEAAKAKFIQESAPAHFARLEKVLGDGSWFVGSAPTYADAVAFETLERYLFAWPDALSAFAKLGAFMKRFEALPGIQAYSKVRRPAA
jgi:glutathione S-transferase